MRVDPVATRSGGSRPPTRRRPLSERAGIPSGYTHVRILSGAPFDSVSRGTTMRCRLSEELDTGTDDGVRVEKPFDREA